MTLQVWTNCRIATMQGDAAHPYGLIDDAAMVVRGERVEWVGPRCELPPQYLQHGAAQLNSTQIDTAQHDITQHDAAGALITPGLIDCHTHLVYGGNRASEFELRLQGASYEEIAKAGGGIVSTVKATRCASATELEAQSLPRLQRLMAEGVTTIEVKSGYGLALEHERKTLAVARALGRSNPVTVRTTFLGAHATPPEFAGRNDDYIDEVLRMLAQLHGEGLVDAVDAFCERIAFSTQQIERVFRRRMRWGCR